jgi:hypothetical protein
MCGGGRADTESFNLFIVHHLLNLREGLNMMPVTDILRSLLICITHREKIGLMHVREDSDMILSPKSCSNDSNIQYFHVITT